MRSSMKTAKSSMNAWNMATPALHWVLSIRMLLPEASELVLSTLPSAEIRECRHILRPIDLYHIEPFLNTDTSSQLGAVTHLDGDRAVMKLPDGFLRLLYFKMSDWEYGVRQPLAFDGDCYRLRCANNARGSRRRSRPAVAIRDQCDERYLEIFGTSAGARTSVFDFIVRPEITDEYADIPLGTFNPVCDKIVEMAKLILTHTN